MKTNHITGSTWTSPGVFILSKARGSKLCWDCLSAGPLIGRNDRHKRFPCACSINCNTPQKLHERLLISCKAASLITSLLLPGDGVSLPTMRWCQVQKTEFHSQFLSKRLHFSLFFNFYIWSMTRSKREKRKKEKESWKMNFQQLNTLWHSQDTHLRHSCDQV